MADTKDSKNLSNLLKELSSIVNWFEDQDDIDVEEGLQKVKLGATLVKSCKSRLQEIENEFKEIQKDMEQGDLVSSDDIDSDDKDLKDNPLPF